MEIRVLCTGESILIYFLFLFKPLSILFFFFFQPLSILISEEAKRELHLSEPMDLVCLTFVHGVARGFSDRLLCVDVWTVCRTRCSIFIHCFGWYGSETAAFYNMAVTALHLNTGFAFWNRNRLRLKLRLRDTIITNLTTWRWDPEA